MTRVMTRVMVRVSGFWFQRTPSCVGFTVRVWGFGSKILLLVYWGFGSTIRLAIGGFCVGLRAASTRACDAKACLCGRLVFREHQDLR